MFLSRLPLLMRLLAALVATGSLSQAAPVISEFLASNGNDLADEDGDSSDWIEIHNPGPEAVTLAGFFLSDDPALLRRWTFPAGSSLLPGERIIVFASGKDRSGGKEWHTHFALAASGGFLALGDSTGNLVSRYDDYPSQRTDISYGRGSNEVTGFFPVPTPAAPNGPAVAGLAGEPVFSAPRGFYEDPVPVILSTSGPGALIRYTTDGSEPTPGSGMPYTGPLVIDETTVLRAIVYGPNLLPGPVRSRTFLFTDDLIRQEKMDPSITFSTSYRAEIHDALKGLPVVALSFNERDLFGFQGIYENPNLKGRESEREIHFEYFIPGKPAESVEAPAGLRIHGGNSRLHPKKPLRLYFRNEYGRSRLEHKLFPDSTVTSFKRLLLRGGGHDAWTFRDNWTEATLLRNQFHHQTQRDMGHSSPHGRHVNVFLNGQYWGIYEMQELPHEHYNADHHGGQPEDWDVVKHQQEVEAGDRKAWDHLMELARAGIRSTADYEAIQEYLDLGHFADAMIQRIWASDEDWLSPYFLDGREVDSFSADKNWYVARRSRNHTSKFFFYNWDAEMSAGIPFSAEQTFELDFSRIDNDGSPGLIYDALRKHPEFQAFFADRLQKHFFNGGALTPFPAQNRWDQLADLLRTPMVAESARWGSEVWDGFDRFRPFTRNREWLPAANWVRNVFIPNRSEAVLAHFQEVALFPDHPAPEASPPVGLSPLPFEVTLTSRDPGAVIYFTTDGSDPRLPGRTFTQSLITEDSPVRVLVPTAGIDAQLGDSWKDHTPPANLDQWLSGANGAGFDLAGDYQNLIQTDLSGMFNTNSSAYLRYQFFIPDQSALDSLQSLLLRMRYDDGFAAYLNGTLVASDNFGGTFWNAGALRSRPDQDAVVFRDFDLSIHTPRLRIGSNLLAIHGQNTTPRNSDFLIEALLEGNTRIAPAIAPHAQIYEALIPVTASISLKARSLDASGQWSPLFEKSYSVARPASAGDLVVSEIHYHPAEAITPADVNTSTNQDDYEFLEFFNRSTQTLDLSGCFFDRGLTFVFPEGSTIPARSRRVIVSNRPAFLARYGPTSTTLVLGEFANDSRLANSGEILSLRDPDGQTIFALRYDDDPPWPDAPDGSGPSLVLRQADTSGPGLSDPASWRASDILHGTPGTIETPTFTEWLTRQYGRTSGPGTRPGEVPPQESESNLILYAIGRELAADFPVLSPDLTRFTFQLRTTLPGVVVQAEASANLSDWQPTMILSEDIRLDGTTLLTAARPQTIKPGSPVFFRLKATLSE